MIPPSMVVVTVMICCAGAEEDATAIRKIAAKADKILLYFRIDILLFKC
jgi:hypothetical protein